VARRLNAERNRTASGASRTARLVLFLLALMFNGTKSETEESKAPQSTSLWNPISPELHYRRYRRKIWMRTQSPSTFP